jgi:exopolysaccharide production protein ExoY
MLIERAIRKFPQGQKARFKEEWHAHIAELHWEAQKILAASGFLFASRRMRFTSNASVSYSSMAADSLVKRAFDLSISLTSIILMAPMMAIVAVFVYVSLGWPIFFVQRRAGLNRHIFPCIKFRTLPPDPDVHLRLHFQRSPDAAPAGAETRALRCDQKVTRVGSILRWTSFDELPLLFNVLRGDMSCIGPISSHSGEGKAKPGLIGISRVGARQRACDRYYIRHWSLLLDLQILFRSVPAIWKIEEHGNIGTHFVLLIAMILVMTVPVMLWFIVITVLLLV